MNISIPTPEGFDLKRTTGSHGWSELLPFEYVNAETLVRVLDVGAGVPVTVTITGGAGGLDARASRRLNQREAAQVARDVRHMMRLDDDMTHFYAAVSSNPEFSWIARDGAGRLLRSPTVFEDLVKSICTTNCTWSLTKLMVTNLVRGLGREAKGGRHAFPTPEAMAAQPVAFYRDVVRAGYRSEYLKELSERVASGEIEPESWLASELTTDQLKRAMKKVKGVGDYAAENLLKLVGRYDVLALDSWVRAQFARKRNKGRTCDDKKIARFYARFDSWRGLALWCDMTQEWFDRQE
jgi:3-methyladenine DNA glycosylase/8-oxoguanine DNA glycosylase